MAHPGAHPFVVRPHRTFAALSLPVLVSLVAEPVTGLVDTGLVARLGTDELAALGSAVVLLSCLLWVLGFLGVGTQTEVAQARGAGDGTRAAEATGSAVVLAVGVGGAFSLLLWPLAPELLAWMGARGGMVDDAVAYFRVRLIGAPAAVVLLAGFGALRGVEDMRTPLWIAIGLNALNVLLDLLLIFGAGPVPAFGVAGAAWATSASQWLGAAWLLKALGSRIGLRPRLRGAVCGRLLLVGRDMVVRTASLNAFLVLATRAATQMGSEAGAAHQAVRQVWTFTALLLDAFAITAQSLVGYFFAARELRLARRVAAVATGWSLATGCALCLAMVAGRAGTALALVPPEAWGVFSGAWVVSALSQPLNSLSFITDGIHWGTGDYAFLRNATVVSTLGGVAALYLVTWNVERSLAGVWAATAVWIGLRALFGVLRVWPGRGGPLRTVR